MRPISKQIAIFQIGYPSKPSELEVPKDLFFDPIDWNFDILPHSKNFQIFGLTTAQNPTNERFFNNFQAKLWVLGRGDLQNLFCFGMR